MTWGRYLDDADHEGQAKANEDDVMKWLKSVRKHRQDDVLEYNATMRHMTTLIRIALRDTLQGLDWRLNVDNVAGLCECAHDLRRIHARYEGYDTTGKVWQFQRSGDKADKIDEEMQRQDRARKAPRTPSRGSLASATCNHCKSLGRKFTGHTDAKCWGLHPELKKKGFQKGGDPPLK